MLNIIYFLDPWVKSHKEQEATLKWHLSFFAHEVQKESNIHLFVISHPELEAYVLKEKIPLKILPLKIRGDETEFEKINKVTALVMKAPDLIIAYETGAQWLNECFDQTVVINEQWGALSRPPFPALTFFDYHGTYQNSVLFKNAAQIRATKLTPTEYNILNTIRTMMVCSLVQTDPLKAYAKKVKQQYKKLILVPLQVDTHISFNDCCHWKNHKLMIYDILNTVDKDIGVIVTQHPDSKHKVINTEDVKKIEKIYSNFIYFPDTENIPMISQWWLLYVDAILTVSSGLAFQAAIINIPVVALGESHINAISSTNLQNISAYIKDNQRDSCISGAIWKIIHTYNFFLDDYRFDIRKLMILWKKIIEKKLHDDRPSKETLSDFIEYYRYSSLVNILIEKNIPNDRNVIIESNFIYNLVENSNNAILSYQYVNSNISHYNKNILDVLPERNIVIFFILLIKLYIKRKARGLYNIFYKKYRNDSYERL